MNKIKVFLRHWNGAINRKQNIRSEWFSYEKCYRSIKNADVDLVILLDGTKENHHFKFDEDDTVIEYVGGSDHASLLYCLNYIQEQNLNEEDIIYIVEDDYLHLPGWENIMKEAFDAFNVDYVSLYDHPDKYFLPMYNDLQSKILYSKSTHWRTTPSCCNTYAGKWGTFKKHWETHIKYCLPEHTHDGYDHTKFLDLWSQGSNLISCLPGYSTHCDEKYFLSPLTDWSKI
jgi:glycosyltransferase involved in cell wall biosynthesis